MKQPTPKFEADVINGGKLKYPDHVKAEIRRWVSTFKPGSRVDIIIRKHSSKRSNDQNAYYWGVVIPILADHFGYDNREDLHNDLKLKFNPIKSKINPGQVIGGTTTTMSTVEFMADENSYVERICRWAAMDHGLYIPPPKKTDECSC